MLKLDCKVFNILLGMFVSKCNAIKALRYVRYALKYAWEALVCLKRNSIPGQNTVKLKLNNFFLIFVVIKI